MKKEQAEYKDWIETLFWIVNKDRTKVPFILNDVQNKYMENRTHNDIILKSRKMGFSSLILALWMVDFLREENVNAVIISHEKEATKRLLARAKYYLNNLPEKHSPELKSKSKTELYNPEKNNRFWVGTAGTKTFGRGDDISHLHLSEFSFWEYPEIVDGILEARVKDAWTVIETTANGVNNSFHRLWERSKVEGDWVPHFYGWQEDKTLRIEVPNSLELTKEEKELKHKYGLLKAQLYWRRKKIANMANPELFPQEYPINDKEAFLASGRTVFDTSILSTWLNNVEKPEFHGNLKRVYKKDGTKFLLKQDTKQGSLRIYEMPEDGEEYVIGADTAGGDEKGDYSAASVRKKSDGSQVAVYLDKLDPDLFAKDLNILGRFYNDALIIPESNNYGEVVINVLTELNYPNIYIRDSFKEGYPEKVDKLGWRTTSKTKGILISEHKKRIREEVNRMVDKNCITQHMGYIYDSKGKMNATHGSYDDLVIADALVSIALELEPDFSDKEQLTDTFVKMPSASGF